MAGIDQGVCQLHIQLVIFICDKFILSSILCIIMCLSHLPSPIVTFLFLVMYLIIGFMVSNNDVFVVAQDCYE